MTTVRIPVDKIGAVIGRGTSGQMINAIQDRPARDITIENDGTIYVGASDGPSAQAAVDRSTRSRTRDAKVGERFLGTRKITPFGAFVSPASSAATAWSTSASSVAAASASARSRTSRTSATRCR